MIKVIKDNNLIKISGHAGFNYFGSDIVCASVSSIIYTTINAIARINKKSIEVSDDSNLMMIKIVNEDEIVNDLIVNMLELLQSLAKDYPKNLSVKES